MHCEIKECSDGSIVIEDPNGLGILLPEEEAIELAYRLNTLFAMRNQRREAPQGKEPA